MFNMSNTINTLMGMLPIVHYFTNKLSLSDFKLDDSVIPGQILHNACDTF